jgi:hypothetical protein
MTPICFTDDFNLIENCRSDDVLLIGKNCSSLSCSYQKLFKKWPDAFYFESDNNMFLFVEISS